MSHHHAKDPSEGIEIFAMIIFILAMMYLIYLNCVIKEEPSIIRHSETTEISSTRDVESKEREKEFHTERKSFYHQRQLFLALNSLQPRNITTIIENDEEDEADSIQISNSFDRAGKKKEKARKRNLGYVSFVFDMTGEMIIRNDTKSHRLLPPLMQRSPVPTIRKIHEEKEFEFERHPQYQQRQQQQQQHSPHHHHYQQPQEFPDIELPDESYYNNSKDQLS
jgi:hypothetical protein